MTATPVQARVSRLRVWVEYRVMRPGIGLTLR